MGATDGADELARVQADVVDRLPERLVLPAEVVEKTGEAFLCRLGVSIDRAPDGSIRGAHGDRGITRVGDHHAGEVHVEVFQAAEQAARKAIRDLAVLVPFSSRPSISATIQGTLTACSWRLGWRVASGHHWPMVR